MSAKTGHSRTSKNTAGGKWVVKDGAIVGSQDVPGNGGIVITEKEYGDFEVALEMNNDDRPGQRPVPAQQPTPASATRR